MAETTEVANPTLRYAKDGAIAWITAENPARMNALTAAMWKAIPDAIAQAVADPDVRVVVLRGAGEKAFSAGADISEFENSRTGDAAKTYDILNDAAFNALIGCLKPTIAMIYGFALAGVSAFLCVAICALLTMQANLPFRPPSSESGIMRVGCDPSLRRFRQPAPRNCCTRVAVSVLPMRRLWGLSRNSYPQPNSRRRSERSHLRLRRTRLCRLRPRSGSLTRFQGIPSIRTWLLLMLPSLPVSKAKTTQKAVAHF